MKKLLFGLFLLIGCGEESQNVINILVHSTTDIEEKEKLVIDMLVFTADILEEVNKNTDFYKSYMFMNKITVIVYDIEYIDVDVINLKYIYARASCAENIIWLGWYHNISLIHEYLHILECRYDNRNANAEHTGIWWDVYEPHLERLWLETH